MTATEAEPVTDGYPPTLLAALAVLQADLPKVGKDNPVDIKGKEGKQGRKYQYAKLEEVSEPLLPKLSKVGLSWSCMLDFDPRNENRWGLHFELGHVSGQKKTGFWPISLNQGPQDIGGWITYADRYALQVATGLAPRGAKSADDDAAGAQQAWQAEQDAKPSEIEIGRWMGEQIDRVFAMDNPAWIESGGRVILADAHKRGERDVKGLVTAADRKVLGADPNAVLTLNDVVALVQGYVESTGKAVRSAAEPLRDPPPDEDQQLRRDPDDPDYPDKAADGAHDADPAVLDEAAAVARLATEEQGDGEDALDRLGSGSE